MVDLLDSLFRVHAGFSSFVQLQEWVHMRVDIGSGSVEYPLDLGDNLLLAGLCVDSHLLGLVQHVLVLGVRLSS